MGCGDTRIQRLRDPEEEKAKLWRLLTEVNLDVRTSKKTPRR
jgi:hypothetical protein